MAMDVVAVEVVSTEIFFISLGSCYIEGKRGKVEFSE